MMLDYDSNYQYQGAGNEYLPAPDNDTNIVGSNEICDPSQIYAGATLAPAGGLSNTGVNNNEIYTDPQYVPQSLYFQSIGAQMYPGEAAAASFGRVGQSFTPLQQHQQLPHQEHLSHPAQQLQQVLQAQVPQQQQVLQVQVPQEQQQLLLLQQQQQPQQPPQQSYLPYPTSQPQQQQLHQHQQPPFQQHQQQQQQIFYSYPSHQQPGSTQTPGQVNHLMAGQAGAGGFAAPPTIANSLSYDVYTRPEPYYAAYPYLDGAVSEGLNSQSPPISEPSPRMSAAKHLGQVSTTFSSISSTSSGHMFNGTPPSSGSLMNSGISPSSKEIGYSQNFARPSIMVQLRSNPCLWEQVTSNVGGGNGNSLSSKKGSFKCSHCTDTFTSLYELVEHLDKYEIRRGHFCPVEDCPWSVIGLARKAELRRHCVLQHFLRGKLKDLTDQSIRSDSRLKMVKLLYSCNKSNCGKHFYRKDSLQRHQRLVHENKDSKFNRKWGKLGLGQMGDKGPYQIDSVYN